MAPGASKASVERYRVIAEADVADKKAGELGIPNPYRGKERLDSIAKAQQPKA